MSSGSFWLAWQARPSAIPTTLYSSHSFLVHVLHWDAAGCFTHLAFLRGLPPSSQIRHTQRLVPRLGFVSCQLFLNYPDYHLPPVFFLSLFLYIFISFSMTCCVAGWLAPDIHLSLFSCSSFSSLLLLFLLSAFQPCLFLSPIGHSVIY